jgi:putative DNA primase/helicase
MAQQPKILESALEILRASAAEQLPPGTTAGEPVDLLALLNNDHGNACRLIALSGADLRYCHATGKWLVWDGKRWAVDHTDQARRLTKNAMLQFLDQAIDRRDASAEKFARFSLDLGRIRNALAMAECEIPVELKQLDVDSYLLNCNNGTVDLRTSELRPHARGDFITKLIRHDYRPEAQRECWIAFLNQIMGGGPEASEGESERAQRMMDYLQRVLGYSLTGSTRERVVFVAYGTGNNGKSTLFNTFRQVVGEYGATLQANTLLSQRESNNTQADLADLCGARFVQTSETERGQRFAQAKLKRITQGSGTIKAVRKFENPIEFLETHKLVVETNPLPIISDADDATFNRLHAIPFTTTIPKDRIDKTLPETLLAGAEGILAWAVAGAKAWYELGLNPPPEIQAANDRWRAESDGWARFLAECCVIGDSLHCLSGVLHAAHQRWAEEEGEERLTLKALGLLLKGRYPKRHTERGSEYQGIGLRPASDAAGTGPVPE